MHRVVVHQSVHCAVMGKLIQINLAEIAQAAAKTGHLFERRDPLRQLLGSAQTDSPAEKLQPLVCIDAHEAVQRKGAWLPAVFGRAKLSPPSRDA